METQIDRQAPGGSHSNIYIMPIEEPFPEGARQDLDIQTHIHTYTHQTKWQYHRPAFVSAFWKQRKGECENERASERAKKKPRMRCVIQPRHGGLGQQGDQESLPIVHTCHTQACMHARHTEKAGSSTENPICCNICQRKVKMSVN